MLVIHTDYKCIGRCNKIYNYLTGLMAAIFDVISVHWESIVIKFYTDLPP